MATIKLLNRDGKDIGTYEMNDAISGIEINVYSMRRAILAEEANSRQGTSQTKERSDVRGGGRKPYKQKKTGRARQGTIRAPHYAHGGVCFGPHPRDYDQKVNRKERQLAIKSAFNSKVIDGALIAIDEISFAEPKTRLAAEFLANVGATEKRVMVLLGAHDEMAIKCFRNIPYVMLRTAPNVSTRDLLVSHKIIASKSALSMLEEAWAK